MTGWQKACQDLASRLWGIASYVALVSETYTPDTVAGFLGRWGASHLAELLRWIAGALEALAGSKPVPAEFLDRAAADPAFFIKEVLGVELDSRQQQLLRFFGSQTGRA